MYLAFGIIFLIASVGMVVGIVLSLIKSSKHGGNFISKKNLFYLIPTFLLIYFLYFVAAIYKGEKIDFFYCFTLISTVLDIFKFEAKSELLAPICAAYPIFYADFVLAFIIGIATAILSIASFFSSRIGNFINVKRALFKGCDIVVGDSSDALKYVKATKNSVLFCPNISRQKYADLLKQRLPILRASLDAKQLSHKLKKANFNVIVFRDPNYSYTSIIETFSKLKNISVKIFLEAHQREMKILKEKFITKADKLTHLYLTGFSKYELMARNFVVNYPITKYIPRSFFNENFTLKTNKQINIVFIGFGKVNYQLFRMFAMQFQFAQEKGEKLAAKPINYHIFDNVAGTLHNEFFSRINYEFDEVFQGCDFPKPETICNLDVCNLDINSIEAKKKFKSLVSKDSFTYFIVSLDKDLADASYAQTIRRLFDDEAHYQIFVRAKNASGEKLNEDTDRIIYFGEEKSLYTHENIVNDDLIVFAQRMNLLYSIQAEKAPEWLKPIIANKDMTLEERQRKLNAKLADLQCLEYMFEKWAELPYVEQASNMYRALNLSFKLNLLGFDMEKKVGNDSGISEEEFNKHYINSGKHDEYSDYSFFFKKEASNVLAYIEHLRWNALYILYDFKQMKKADIKIIKKTHEDGKVKISMPHKNLNLKHHACITTYYGLHELVSYKYKSLYPNDVSIENNYKDNAHLNELGKVYAYDYIDLDRLYSEITYMGYILKLQRNNS